MRFFHTAIEGSAGDPNVCAHFWDGMTLISKHPPSLCHFSDGLELSWSPAHTSHGSCRCQFGIGALSNQIALKFSRRPHQKEDEFASCRRGINLLCETDELDTVLIKALEELNEMGE
jgi:hypothetical protein